MSYKFIYWAQRNPELKGRFRPRWRRHAALAMTLPPVWDDNLVRYAQYDPAPDPPPEVGVTARFDGIGMVWLKGAGDYEEGMQSEAMAIMQRDEAETFSTLVHNTAFICTETVLKDDGGGYYKVFSSIDRGDGVSRDDFAAAVEAFARSVLENPALDAWIARLSVCLPNELSGGGGRKQDGLIEYSFHTLANAGAFFGSSAFKALAGARAGKIVEIERYASREVMIEDFEIYD